MSTFLTTTSNSRPSSPTSGDVYFETDTKNVIIWDGSFWRGYQYDNLILGSLTNTYSVDFDGTNDHATLGTNVLFDTTAAFSASYWLTLDGYTNGYPYSLCFKTDLSQPFIIGASNQSNYQGIYFGIPTNTVDLSTKSTTIQNALLTGWHHICVTYNGNGEGTDSNYKLYYDGVEQTLYGTLGLGSITNTNYFARASSSSNFTDGKLDEISIYNTELTAGEVSGIYNSGVAGVDLSALNPLGWWRMGDNDSGTGTTITDQGSGGNDATLVNGPTFSTSVPS